MSRKTIITIVVVALAAVGGLWLSGDERSAACELLCPGASAGE